MASDVQTRGKEGAVGRILACCVMTILLAAMCAAHGPTVMAADENEPPEAMTKAEFSKKIYRGVPKTDVLKFLGKPTEEKPGDAGNVELRYKDRIIEPSTGRREHVTVIVFLLYDSVGAVRWADGSVTEAAAAAP